MPDIEALVRALASPEVYPHKLDDTRTKVALIRLAEAEYRAASFLDDRILTPQTKGGGTPLPAIIEATRMLTGPRPLHFIFHIGHVGSTLLSRLLDELPGVLSLREPLPLRQLADAPDDAILGAFIKLWSRGFPSTRAVVLKATSSAARLAPELLAARRDARAVYLYLDAEPYLAALLAGENSAQDLEGHRPERMARLAAHLGEPLSATGTGELAAMSWLTERLTMQSVVAAHKERVMTLDFDALLTNVDHVVAAVGRHLRLNADPPAMMQMKNARVLMRYSKAPGNEYSPQVRAQIIEQSRRDNTDEIARGMAWLTTAARRNRGIAALVGTA